MSPAMELMFLDVEEAFGFLVFEGQEDVVLRRGLGEGERARTAYLFLLWRGRGRRCLERGH